MCFLLAASTAGLTVWIIQRAFARLEWQSAELSRVSWHMLDGNEKMARRFSHEMHDELGQSLSGLRRMLGTVADGTFGAVRQECIGIVDEVLQSVRKPSQMLRPLRRLATSSMCSRQICGRPLVSVSERRIGFMLSLVPDFPQPAKRPATELYGSRPTHFGGSQTCLRIASWQDN